MASSKEKHKESNFRLHPFSSSTRSKFTIGLPSPPAEKRMDLPHLEFMRETENPYMSEVIPASKRRARTPAGKGPHFFRRSDFMIHFSSDFSGNGGRRPPRSNFLVWNRNIRREVTIKDLAEFLPDSAKLFHDRDFAVEYFFLAIPHR